MITTLEIELEKLAEPLLFPGFTWQQFKAVEPLLDVPGVKVSFLDGVLEIRRVPGKKHEVVKKRIGILVEVYLEVAGIPHTPTGSMTLESESGLVRREAGSGLDLWIGSDIHPKLVAVDEQTNDHIVQPDRLRKTNRFAS